MSTQNEKTRGRERERRGRGEGGRRERKKQTWSEVEGSTQKKAEEVS